MELLRSSRPSSPVEALAAVDNFTRRHLVLIGEAEELIHTPELMLADIEQRGEAWGDCDDAAVLNGALLASVGFPVRLVAIKEGARYVHVFVEAFDGGDWWRLDPVVDPRTSFEGLERMVVDV